MSQLQLLRQAAAAEDMESIRQALRTCVHGFHDEPSAE
jgi:hypothetical protein